MAASLFEGEDLQLYGRIVINKQPVEGLLDSGAMVTCLGKGCMNFVKKAD